MLKFMALESSASRRKMRAYAADIGCKLKANPAHYITRRHIDRSRSIRSCILRTNLMHDTRREDHSLVVLLPASYGFSISRYQDAMRRNV